MKMHKRVLKVAVVSALAVAFAVPAFANPFSDVPAKHWSYDAVNKLSQAGVIDGYGDGTFKGDRTMTRYEMAQIVAKAMTKTLNADQQASVDKLSREYAAELNTLGVKVDGMQTQINDMVKISGDLRGRYTSAGNGTDVKGYNGGDTADLRARVAFDGKIDNNVRFNARLSGSFNTTGSYDPSDSATTGYQGRSNNKDVNINLDTANVSYKALTLGRQDVTMGTGILMDDTMNGLAVKTGGLKLYAGKTTGSDNYYQSSTVGNAYTANVETMYGAEYKIGAIGKANLGVDYLKIAGNKAYGVNAELPLGKVFTAQGDYVKNDTNDASAIAFGVKIKPLGLTVTHRDADAGVYNAYSNANSMNSDVIALPTDVAIKGMEYQYDQKMGKNAALNVKYQDFDHMDARTSAAVTVKF